MKSQKNVLRQLAEKLFLIVLFFIGAQSSAYAICSPTVSADPVTTGQSITFDANCDTTATTTYTWTVFGQSISTSPSPVLTITVPSGITGLQTASVFNPGAGPGSVSFTVNGTALQPLVLSATTFVFPGTKVGTLPSTSAITVTNPNPNYSATTQVSFDVGGGADFQQINNCGTIAPLGQCTVNIFFSPQTIGNQTTVLRISDPTLGNTFVELGGTGTALCAPTVTPSSVTAGASINLNANCTARPGIAESFSWSVLGLTLGTTNPTLNYTVPTNTNGGTYPVSLLVGGPTIIYTAATALTVSPLPGNLVVASTQYTYPDTKVGLQQVNSFTITNNGLGTASISNVLIGSVNGADFTFTGTNSCAGGAVSPNSFCTFNVAFSPQALGARAAQINLVATNSSSLPTINLNGNGTALCAPTVTPNSIPAGGSVTLNAGCTAIPNVTASYSWTILNQTLTTTNAALPFTVPANTALATVPVNVTTNGQTLIYPTATALTVTAPLVGNLAVAPTTYAYPDTQLGAQQTNAFTVTNNGTAAATVTGITIGGANAAEFTQTNTCTNPIGPTGTCSITIAFKPTALGNRVAQASIAASNSTTQPTITLSGNGIPVPVPVVTLSSASIAFPNVTIGASNTQTVSIQNTGTANLVIGSITIAGADFTQSNTCSAAVIPINSCTITVVFSPTAAVARTGTITITDNASGSPRQLTLTGTGTPTPVPVATLSAITIAFPTVTIGGSNTQTVVIQNTGTANLVIGSVAIAGADFTQSNTCSTAVIPTNSCTITAVFSPTAAVARSGTITITDNAGGSPRTVALTGTGTPTSVPVVTLSKVSVPFPSTTIGASNTQTVSIQNTGTANLVIGSIVIAGTDFTQSNNCSTAVIPTNSCTITAVFSPTAAVARTGTITITDNASGSPRQLTLTGTGTPTPVPVVTLSATNIAFPNVTVGSSNTQTISVQNTGTANLVVSSVAITGTDFTQSNTCATAVTPTNSCTITTVFSSTAAVARTGTITITDNAGGSPRGITLTGSGVAVVVPPSASPFGPDRNIALPSTIVGQESQVTINLSNGATTSVGFKGANFRGANTADFLTSSTCPATLQPAQACQLKIVFKPLAAGARTVILDLADDVTASADTALTINAVGAVSVLTPAQITLIAGQQIAATLRSTQLGIQTQLTNINRRIRYLRFHDSTPGFQQEINVSANGKGGPLSSAAGGGGCGASGAQGAASSNQGCDEDLAGLRSRRWGAYVSGSIGVNEDKLSGAQVNTSGITVGSDYRLGGKSAIGAAFGTMKSNTMMAGDAGKQDASGYSFVAYASFAPSQTTYIDFALTSGNNKFDLQRTEATGTTAVAHTQGNGLGMSLTAGYDWRSGGWAFTPYGRIEYLKSKVKAFNERGTEPIAVGDQLMTSNLTTLGTELQYTQSTSWGVFVPHLRVEFQNQSQSADEAKAQAVGGGVQLTVTPELNKDKSFGNVAIGASAQFGKGKTGFLDVEQTVGKTNFKDQRITSGFKVEF